MLPCWTSLLTCEVVRVCEVRRGGGEEEEMRESFRSCPARDSVISCRIKLRKKERSVPKKRDVSPKNTKRRLSKNEETSLHDTHTIRLFSNALVFSDRWHDTKYAETPSTQDDIIIWHCRITQNIVSRPNIYRLIRW